SPLPRRPCRHRPARSHLYAGTSFPMKRRWSAMLLLLLTAGLAEKSFSAPPTAVSVGGPVAPDGKTEVSCDLPVEQRIKNIGSRANGAGMCVASSWEMAMRYQGL